MTISMFATQSMHAIDDWLKVAQGNLTGSTRTSFKESIIMYLGGVTSIDNSPTSKAYGKMLAEQALNTGYTRIDWRQGEITATTQETHFAINGEGFFLVVDPNIRLNLNSPIINTTLPKTGIYLTRDGEFSWRPGSEIEPNGFTLTPDELYLVTKEGLLVLSDNTSLPPASGISNNIYTAVSKTDFDNEDPFSGYNLKTRPSIVQPTGESGDGTAPSTAFDYDMLRFSKYGSTVFNVDGVRSLKTIVNGSNGVTDSRDLGGPNFRSQLIEKSLEGSNTDTAANVTEMAILGKVYNGFIQLIKVYNGSMDEILGFIR